MNNYRHTTDNDFKSFSNGYFNNSKDSNDSRIEFIMVNGKKIEVFTIIEYENKIYFITKEKGIQGETKFDIFIKNGNEYIQPEKGIDKNYDYYKTILEKQVFSDSIVTGTRSN